MSLRRWLADTVFAQEIEQRALARAAELRESVGRSKDEGWRRITDAERDLPSISVDRQREVAIYLWTVNPVARRIVNAIVEWVVGEGVQIHSPHPKTQELIDRHWVDPVNRWDQRIEDKVRELYMMGEQFWPGFQNPYSGIIRLGVLDPSRVKEVVLDPDNALVPIGVITREKPGVPERRFRTYIRSGDRDMISPVAERERERMVDGELFTAAVNKLSTASRGLSELYALADWVEGYETMMFGVLTQERIRSQYLWDVELAGASEAEIQERLKTIQPPKPLSIRVHNEKEKWNLVGPDAGAAGANAENTRLFRNHVLGGANMPEHWFGGGGDVNRATASEMGTPTEKGFTAKQKTIRYLLEEVLGNQVDRGIEVGAVPDDAEARIITVTMPELSARDVSRVGPALQQIAAGLQLAEAWVDDDTAVRVMASIIAHTGVEADPQEMLEKARQGQADKMAQAFDRRRLDPELTGT